VGFEIDGLPGGDNQLLRLGMAIEAVLEPLPPPDVPQRLKQGGRKILLVRAVRERSRKLGKWHARWHFTIS
jgi:hypothetical protein